jgi:hypothetical protein
MDCDKLKADLQAALGDRGSVLHVDLSSVPGFLDDEDWRPWWKRLLYFWRKPEPVWVDQEDVLRYDWRCSECSRRNAGYLALNQQILADPKVEDFLLHLMERQVIHMQWPCGHKSAQLEQMEREDAEFMAELGLTF